MFLRPSLFPILEFERQQAVPVDYHAVDNLQPKPLVEMFQRLVKLPEPEHEGYDSIFLGHTLGAFLFHLSDLLLRIFVPGYQPIVLGKALVRSCAIFVSGMLLYAKMDEETTPNTTYHNGREYNRR